MVPMYLMKVVTLRALSFRKIYEIVYVPFAPSLRDVINEWLVKFIYDIRTAPKSLKMFTYRTRRQACTQPSKEARNQMIVSAVTQQPALKEKQLRSVVNWQLHPCHDSCTLSCGNDPSPKPCDSLVQVDGAK